MIPTAARGFDRLFGSALAPPAAALRGAALVALLVFLLVAAARAIRGFLAWRHGWESATIVRCPQCGLPAADPLRPLCPEGHSVRFPPMAAVREARRTGRPRSRRWGGLLAPAVIAAWALAAVAAASAFRIVDSSAPALASIAGSAGYLFFLVALAAAARATSAARHGVPDRILSAAAGIVLVAPALFCLALARAADPPAPRLLGSLWATPTAIYAADGSTPRRILPAGPLEAEVVEIHSPLFGVDWRGLSRLRSGERDAEWRGAGGTAARLLARLARVSGGAFRVTVSRRPVDTPPNVRVWIFRSPEAIEFRTDAGPDLGPPD